MAGILLDTHALYWLVSGEQELSDEALIAIGESQDAGTLYVSPITAWELSLAARKRNNAPQLGDGSAGRWFQDAIRETTAKVAPIGQKIAIEAAEVVSFTGHKDPGDCYLIATARMKKIPIVSRDGVMLEMAGRPNYLSLIEC
ncbi:PIN domain-containing protein [Rhizobium leguminosarum bv. viciae]|uniref:PIN domain-containing protein n=1 Tax=Rhizobium leguminosarum TaxID=384 RepID=UPI001442554F|nr:PIN domain-containing protein [Rhizobium leguminosarum bv. viciae]